MREVLTTPQNLDNCVCYCPIVLGNDFFIDKVAHTCRSEQCSGPIITEEIADISAHTSREEDVLFTQYSIMCGSGVNGLKAVFGMVPDDYIPPNDPSKIAVKITRTLTQEEIRQKPVEVKEWVDQNGK